MKEFNTPGLLSFLLPLIFTLAAVVIAQTKKKQISTSSPAKNNRIDHHMFISSALATDYFKSLIQQLFHTHKVERCLMLIYEHKEYLISEFQLEIMLPGTGKKDNWDLRKKTIENLHRGCIRLLHGKEVYVYFTFMEGHTDKVIITDVPFMAINYTDILEASPVDDAPAADSTSSIKRLPPPINHYQKTLHHLIAQEGLQRQQISFQYL